METTQKAEAYIPEWKQAVGIHYHPGMRADLKVYRPSPESLQPLARDKVNPETRNKKTLDSLKQPFVCLSVLVIAYTFTYSTLQAIALIFSRQ